MGPSPSACLLYANACYNFKMGELTKKDKSSSDISKVTDGLNAVDALKAAAKAIANKSPEILTGVLAHVLPPVLPLVRLFHAGAKNNFLKQLTVEAGKGGFQQVHAATLAESGLMSPTSLPPVT